MLRTLSLILGLFRTMVRCDNTIYIAHVNHLSISVMTLIDCYVITCKTCSYRRLRNNQSERHLLNNIYSYRLN